MLALLAGIVTLNGLADNVVKGIVEKPVIIGVLATIEYSVGVPVSIIYGTLKLVAVLFTCEIVPIVSEVVTNGVAVTLAMALVQVPLLWVKV